MKTIDFSAIVGCNLAVVQINVVESLGINIVLGYEFCSAQVLEIHLRHGIPEFLDRTAGPILKGLLNRSEKLVPIPQGKEYGSLRFDQGASYMWAKRLP